jgi:osmotically-inducible protein OsmY
LTGCAGQASTAATDGRVPGDPAADAKVCASIRSKLRAQTPGSLSVLSVLCHNQVVVIAGALPPDYKPAAEAVHIATKTPGVRRVETFFVPKAAQDTSDSAIAARIKIALAGDAGTSTAGTDLTVVAGTVVLVGMVDDQAKADRIIANAGSVAGVKGVKSFIQLKP